MAATAAPGGGGPSISRKLRRRSRLTYALLAGALAVNVAAAAVLLLDYRPAAARYDRAMLGLRDAASAVQDQRAALWSALAVPGAGVPRDFAAAQNALRRADGVVLRSGADGGRVLDDLIAVNSAEAAWTGWAVEAVQQANALASSPAGSPQAGVTPAAQVIQQGSARYAAYRAASRRAIADVTSLGSEAVSNERTVILYWLVVAGALLVVAVLFLMWTRRRLAKTTAAAVDSLLNTVRRVEAGEEVDLRALDPPAELAELSRVLVGLALELESVRGAVGVSSSRGEERARRLAQVLELTQSISGHLSIPAVLSAIAESVLEISGAEQAVVWLAEDDGLHSGAKATAGRAAASGGPGAPAGAVSAGPEAGPAGARRHDDPTPGTHSGPGPDKPGEPVVHAATYGRTQRNAEGRHQQVAVPMTYGGRVLGVIDLRGREIGRIAEEELSLIETLASHGAGAVGVAREHGVAESMSMTDPLTHLPNRRQLDHDLATECERARRYRRSSALLMLDIDGFKAFNDRHGHIAADQILSEFGRLLAEAIRGSDSAYRYGGDEFVVLVREASVAAASDLAERLRHLIEERFSVLPPDAPVTASFGVVGVDQVDPEPATLLRAADEALYSAKDRGRNRVVAFR